MDATATNEIKIPKFRTINGLVKWVANNKRKTRLPSDREEVFFKLKELKTTPQMIYMYSSWVGPLDRELERLMFANPTVTADYIVRCWHLGREPDDEILSVIKESDALILRVVRSMKARVPEWLEDQIRDPSSLVTYAKIAIRGRLPERLEQKLVGDLDACNDYAFGVIRGLASPKLPDPLHTFMVLKSFEMTDDEDLKEYFREIKNSSGMPE